MKPLYRVIAALMLLGITALVGLVAWRMATRPTAIGWSDSVIQSRITRGMSRDAVLKLLGPPHQEMKPQDGYMYFNSYLSREARHQPQVPSNFAIFFEDDKVTTCMRAFDY